LNDVVSTGIQAIGWILGLVALLGVLPYAVGMIGQGVGSARRIRGLLLAGAALLVVSGLAATSINIPLGLALVVPGIIAALWLLRDELRRRDTRFL
jgi:hypothetical protein